MKVLRSLVIEYNVNPAWFLLGTGNFHICLKLKK